MNGHLIDRPDGRTGGENWTDNYTELCGGEGPRLHLHPYAETFIIRRGGATFSIGRPLSEVHAHAGQVLVVEADTPHKFVTDEEGYEAVHIHSSPYFETTWLE
ncbi:Cupin domain-containing protein [Brevibacterium sandarakinum]|uniref:Cupin domain-containing protein n=1 Tax=Brevibacterium sandarakinum TaxID=629680 RepID=A0A1H1XZD0_BRESA|nr:cupin domain-containing protein [Brevibacterium sandarakinum]SDT14608.1 Cupin domain-containing protein [Brevibacterium sandarakinum]